ncbi:MAG: hypothetical protein CL763_08640 [Chloroflexi bacterium]|nr:hypothetical protein [Chloroflexota bacterium]|tara:strand:- start:7756 stop:9735 length:1980 start_codon:yes stop_codon:yes gene_type:complete
MIIKKIEVHNFGPFYGSHVWDELEPEEGKPLILIRARNDVAKSTILKIFNFCLYGLTPSKRQSVINRKAAFEDDGECSILFSFTHRGDDYEMKRTLKFKKVKEFLDPPDISLHRPTISRNGIVMADPQGTPGVGYDADVMDFVKELIPQEISQFFFFDGERIQDYVNEEPKPSITEAIEQILGIKQLLNARYDINKVTQTLETELLEAQETDQDTKEEAKKLIQRKTELDTEEAKLKYSQDELKTKEDSVKNLKSFLENQDGLQEDWDKINKITGALTALTTRKNTNVTKLLRHNDHNLLSEIMSIHFPSSPITPKLFSSSQIRMAKDSISKNKCAHCDEPLSETKKAELITIAETKFDPIETDIQDILSRIKNDPELTAASATHQILIATAGEIDGQITNGEKALKKAKEALSGSAETVMEDVKKKQTDYDRLLPELESAKIAVAEKETELQRKKADYDADVNALSTSTSNERVVLAQARLNICKKTFKAFDEIIKAEIDNTRLSIAKQMSDTFTQHLTNNPELYTGLDLDPEYKLLVKQHAFDPLPAWKLEPSSGMSAMIAFSFIHALNSHSQTEAPIVIDTPTGRLDEIHSPKIINFWKNFGNQVFVLYQPKEITPEENHMIEPFVTKHYEAKRKPAALGQPGGNESLLADWDGEQ